MYFTAAKHKLDLQKLSIYYKKQSLYFGLISLACRFWPRATAEV